MCEIRICRTTWPSAMSDRAGSVIRWEDQQGWDQRVRTWHQRNDRHRRHSLRWSDYLHSSRVLNHSPWSRRVRNNQILEWTRYIDLWIEWKSCCVRDGEDEEPWLQVERLLRFAATGLLEHAGKLQWRRAWNAGWEWYIAVCELEKEWKQVEVLKNSRSCSQLQGNVFFRRVQLRLKFDWFKGFLSHDGPEKQLCRSQNQEDHTRNSALWRLVQPPKSARPWMALEYLQWLGLGRLVRQSIERCEERWIGLRFIRKLGERSTFVELWLRWSRKYNSYFLHDWSWRKHGSFISYLR